jgi:hypothetical protein
LRFGFRAEVFLTYWASLCQLAMVYLFRSQLFTKMDIPEWFDDAIRATQENYRRINTSKRVCRLYGHNIMVATDRISKSDDHTLRNSYRDQWISHRISSSTGWSARWHDYAKYRPKASCSGRFAEADIIVDHRVRSDRDPAQGCQIQFAENDLATPHLTEESSNTLIVTVHRDSGDSWN